ncbi:MAG: M28 family metallopeptidase [Blastocatellales bacterium]
MEAVTRKLTSPEFNGRAYKTEGGRKAAEYIASLFRDAGLKAPAGRSDLFQSIASGGQNIVGVIEGRDAARKNEYVIVGAHYDAFGNNFAGAMDNAAGVAVMIEIARTLAKNPPQRSALFIAFDGGEQHNAGANYYAEHPIVPLEKTAAMINLSGFGGGMSEQLYETLYVIGSETSPQLREAVSKHKRGEAHLALAHFALIGRDVMRWPGGEHFLFTLKQTPTITITNGVHYAYHSKDDMPNRINYAALEKHAAALTKVVAEIANTPGKIEKSPEPVFDKDEPMEWHRVLTTVREAVIKTPGNGAGQTQIDDVLFELKRHQGRAVQDVKAREVVILRAANIVFYIVNPDGVKYNALLNTARNYEQSGQRQQAIAAYQRLLKFIEEESRRDDQTISEIRARLAKLEQQRAK